MIERTLWHPVADAASLAASPLAVQLLDENLVLWRDDTGSGVHAFSDRCPHRGARLSLGCVRGRELQCAYHGWRFDTAGQAVAVPALRDYRPPATHRVAGYAVQERYGLLWIRLAAPAGDDAGPPAFGAEADSRLRKVNCGPYTVATSAPRIVENFLDMAHFPFVHEDWLGDRGHLEVEDYRIEFTPTGFLATDCRAWQPKSSVHAESGAQVEYTYEVNAPYTAVLCKVPDAESVRIGGFRESIALFVCPMTPESSMVWFRLAMTDFASADETLQRFQHTIFNQDRPILESQAPKRLPISPTAPVQEVHCAADRSSAAYRRYLRERGVSFGVC